VINEVNKVRLPFNVNALSQKVAVEALQNGRKLKSDLRLIISERKGLFKGLRQIEGVTPYPSDANFIFFRVKDADEVYGQLLAKGVLVRNLNSAVKGCLRVTVGTPAENAAFLKVLRQVL
ncbi:MAG: aminotransferase class I/II-fold pyridoxal phosphate-dependent enzyme, partial [Nitrospirota bacterium]